MIEKFVWHPPRELVEGSNVKRFMDKWGIESWQELIKKSIEDPEWFWPAAAEEIGCEWFKPYTKVLDASRGVEWAKWFIDGKINIAHNALDRHARSSLRNKLAFIWQGEDGTVKKYSYRDLYVEVNRFANGLKSLGVGRGDVVATLLPMLPETVITLFATLKLGAIFLPIFSGFGPSAIAARLEHSGAKILVTADGTHRRGRIINLKGTVDEATRRIKTLKNVVVVERANLDVSWVEGRDVWWSELCDGQPRECPSEPLDSDHPALLLYTSGTTGRPKGAVISHIGALLQSAKEIYFNLDLKPEDLFLWITDIGWMMGPWQIIGVQHLLGTHFIFEGAVDHPRPDRIWAAVEEFGLTHLGGSATVFRMLKSFGDRLVKAHDLDTLRILGNTGEPIDPDTWLWLLQTVGQNKCPIINLSGGTEIFGCFLLPLPVMPLKPTTLGGPGLGMDVDVFDDEGKPIRGQIGYLVCKKPAPSMTRGFWREPERYLETYWSRWRGVWYHGDWASIDEEGFWYLHGRADDVIKIAGKRLGPAEVESIVNNHPAVRESAAIGIPHEVKGETLACFVSLKPGYKPSPELESELKSLVASSMGKPFTPERIIFVKDLPKNRAGKIMRRMIRAVVLNMPIGDLSIVENPEALKEIEETIKS